MNVSRVKDQEIRTHFNQINIIFHMEIETASNCFMIHFYYKNPSISIYTVLYKPIEPHKDF